MAASKRVKREAPVRRGPIRNRAIPVDAPHTAGGAYTMGAVVDESVKTAMRAVEAADATVRGAVERGVDTAYMVIEEYMLRGRQAAGRNHQRRNGGREMNEDRQSGGGYGGGAAGPWNTINPFMAPWMQMMRMWTDNMAAFIPGANGASDWMSQFIPGAAAWGAARPTVSVHVASPRPVEVSANVDAGADYAVLSVEPLVHTGGRGDVLTGITAECTPGRIRLVVNVSAGQATGHYTGSLVDSNGNKRGTVQVDVLAARDASRPAGARKAARKKATRKRAAATRK